MLDWPQSGPVWTVAFFEDRLKRLDCTVQYLWTVVRSQKYWTRPFGPVLLNCSPVWSEKKLDRTVQFSLRLNCSYAYINIASFQDFRKAHHNDSIIYL